MDGAYDREFPGRDFPELFPALAAQARRLSRGARPSAAGSGPECSAAKLVLQIEDADLFPPQNVTLNGMKIYSDRSVSQIIGFPTPWCRQRAVVLRRFLRKIMHNRTAGITASIPSGAMRRRRPAAEIRGDVILAALLAL